MICLLTDIAEIACKSLPGNKNINDQNNDDLLINCNCLALNDLLTLFGQVLTLLLSELLSIMRDSGRSFVSYISDLLGRCKLRKALLHTLLACVYNVRLKLSGMCTFIYIINYLFTIFLSIFSSK